MKIKILGDWCGLSFGVFLLVAALLAIPAGEWIGGLLMRSGQSLPRAEVIALAQNPADAPAVHADLAQPADLGQKQASTSNSLPSPLSSEDVVESSALRGVSDAKPPVAAARNPAKPAAIVAPEGAAQISPTAGAKKPAPGTGETWLQVAALTREDNAQALANALVKKGYPVFVKEPHRDTLYRVQVGPYPDRQAAQTAAQALRADGFDVIVIG